MNNKTLISGIKRQDQRRERDIVEYSVIRGLTTSEVLQSEKKFGRNVIEKKESITFFKRFISNFSDPIIRILLCACGVNIAVNLHDINWIEICGILCAVFVSTFISALFEHNASGAFDKLNERSEEIYTLVRNGQNVKVKRSDIVVGDIIKISAGEVIPCDGIMISGEISCDQSVLTGESHPKKKSSRMRTSGTFSKDHFTGNTESEDEVYSGCGIVSGEGYMLSVKVGKDSYFGVVASEIKHDKNESPLKNRLGILAKKISSIGYIAATLVALAYLFNSFVIDSSFSAKIISERLSDTKFIAKECLSALTLAISVLVVAVPEGLPMMITVVLSSNMKRMVKRNVLVKRMVGIETGGSLGILFCDKTGTLTEGKMGVTRIICPDGEYSSFSSIKKNGLLCASICAPTPTTGKNQTDLAFSFFSNKKSVNTLRRLPFDSSRKYSAALVHGNDSLVTVVRGAPDILMRYVSHIYANGERRDITAEEKASIENVAERISSFEGRVIMLCFASGDECDRLEAGEIPPLTYLGLADISDKMRSDAVHSVQKAKEAGIHVIMITGDGIKTASAVARKCKILENDGICISGEELRSMTDSRVCEILPRLSVVARTLPTDKLRLVELAKKAGYVTGMTGDGVNDAPSLCSADVGFAMGSGSEVALSSADIVIIDSSLNSIINAVLFGRTIFKSIRKFITFQLTMNLCATAVSFLGPFIGVEAPVTVVQMLWINMIMDTLGALAFAGEAPEGRYLREKPIPRSEGLVTGSMLARILLSSTFMTTVCISFLKIPYFREIFEFNAESYFLTEFFVVIIFMGIFTSFCVRTDRVNIFSGLLKNPMFILIMTAASAIQFGLVEFGGSAIRCVPLVKHDAVLAVLIASTVIPIQGIIKVLFRNKN